MKLEKYTKQTGAFFRPMYKEVQEKDIVQDKGERTINVESIIVNVMLESGTSYDFQGDETSQNRLGRSGWAMDKTNTPLINWKTADNQVVQISTTDIANILLAAGQAQSALWF